MNLADFLKQMTWVEWLAAAFTLVNVWLVSRADIRNYPFGIVSVILYAWVFWTQRLYANFWLQVAFFLPMQFIGWWVWLRTGPEKDDDLPVAGLSTTARAGWIGASIVGTGLVGLLMSRTTNNPQPYVDAFTTVGSVIGQYMLTRKWMENWIAWLAVDVVFVFWLFPRAGLWASTGVYAILMAICVMGLLKWIRAAREGAAHA
jgi:nicotinamide mononucleotide transporter